jgi:hypothetical protein
MASESYLSWDEFDEDASIAPPDPPHDARLATLLAERERLARELDRLLGNAPPSDDEARENARFPMPIHTAESRLEDRRRANEELRARAAMRRALEARRLQILEEKERADRKRQQEREAIQRELLRVAEENRRRELVEDMKRSRRLAELVQHRWLAQRRAALRSREAARRAEWTVFDERSARMRELAAAVSAERNRERAEIHKRLDDRAERARLRRPGRNAD